MSGSDLADSAATRRLARLGATIALGHAAANIANADAVVVSTAVAPDNPEVLAARERGIPVVPRALMLAELMRLKQGIAVAGTHGKTTTTSLIASVLAEGGLDPTFVIGGRLLSADANARLGKGEFLVAEADESDASFLYLSPVLAVVTNIDADHMETYEHDFGKLTRAFVDFLQRLPFYGVAVVCVDDANVRALLPDVDEAARHLRARGGCRPPRDRRRERRRPHAVRRAGQGCARPRDRAGGGRRPQRAQRARRDRHRTRDRRPRRGDREGARGVPRRRPPLPAARRRSARGRRRVHADRRLRPPSGRDGGDACPRRARASPGRRLVLAFQPHRYTRTRDLFEDFVRVLSTVDALVLADVYPAGEAPIVAADGRALARAVRVAGKVEPVFVENVADLPATHPHDRARRRRRASRWAPARSARPRRSCAHDHARAHPLHRPARQARARTRRSRSTRAGARAGRRTRCTCPPTATISPRSCASCPPSEPLTVLGLGSNTLVRDGGVRGTVVVMHNPGAMLADRRRPRLRGRHGRGPEARALRGEPRLRGGGVPGRRAGHRRAARSR